MRVGRQPWDGGDWENWHWQLQNQVRTLDDVRRYLTLTPSEEGAFEAAARRFPVGITPYYLSLVDRDDPNCPVRRQCIPGEGELTVRADEQADPLAEDSHMPVPGLTHRYPDRALLYTSHACAMYCRHCNRRRKVGDPASAPSRDDMVAWVTYLRAHPAVRDVLVSGGDPLSLSDGRLDWLLGQLRQVGHLELIRLATRHPVTLPQRITDSLCTLVRAHHPIFVSTHFNHPKECTDEAARALNQLADAGCVLSNQMVLLRGINDDPTVVKDLNHWLLRQRCRPYYIFQCDLVEGTSAFRTPIQKGVDIIGSLRGWTSGLAVPHYVVDLPGGGGKVSVQPDYLRARVGAEVGFVNYEGKAFTYQEAEEP